MAFDLTALATALGAYSRQNSREVLQQIINDSMVSAADQPISARDLMRLRFFRDEQAFARVNLNIQVRERTNTVVEQVAAAIEVEGDIRKLRDIESIFSIVPEALENTWLDETVYDAPNRTRSMPELADMELVPWITQDILRKFTAGLLENTVFQGEHVPGNTYASSYPGAYDGYLTQVADRITGGDITQIVVMGGALTALNTYAKLEAIGAAIPYHLKNRELFMLISEELHDWYNDGHAAAYPGQNHLVHAAHRRFTLKHRPRVVLVPVAEMVGSQRVVVTTADNMSWNHDFRGQEPIMKYAVKDVKTIQVAIQASQGVSFDRFDSLVVNDLA